MCILKIIDNGRAIIISKVKKVLKKFLLYYFAPCKVIVAIIIRMPFY